MVMVSENMVIEKQKCPEVKLIGHDSHDRKNSKDVPIYPRFLCSGYSIKHSSKLYCEGTLNMYLRLYMSQPKNIEAILDYPGRPNLGMCAFKCPEFSLALAREIRQMRRSERFKAIIANFEDGEREP